MQAPVIVPDVRLEAGIEMVVSCWFVDEGDDVLEGDQIVEILAGPVTFDVAAPATGRLVQIRAAEEDVVLAGTVLAIVESEDDEESQGSRSAGGSPAASFDDIAGGPPALR